MLFLLSKRLRLSFIFPNHKIHPFLARFCSGSATQISDLKTPHFNVVDYLVSSCGVSPEKAARISKPISHLRSPENPDAVLGFLKQQGFAEAEITTLITLRPKLLCSPQKSLDTNLRALRDIGLSDAALKQIILSGPAALMLRSAVPRIMFWRDFLQGDEAALVKTFKKALDLVGHEITQSFAPKLSFLQSQGLSTQDVRRIVLYVPRFIVSSTQVMKDLLKRTKELGFQPRSKMFVHGLAAMIGVSPELLQRKMELLNSFGWSNQEFHSALRILPQMASLSENNLRTKMNFFMAEVRCEPSYIASNPTLLTYSLEKRLRPRHHILHLLELKGLSVKKQGFYAAITLPNAKFVERYVAPHKENFSELHDTYLAACASEQRSPVWKVEVRDYT